MDRLRDDLNLLARATGTQDRAATLLDHMDSVIADGKAALSKAGADGTPFLIADGWMQGSTVAIRMFANGSQMSDIVEALGLRNAWTTAGDKQWGLGQTDVEGLTGMTDPDLHLFYSASEEDVFADGLAKNPIWSSLPFVQPHRLTKLDKGTWTFGGPASVEFVVHQIVAAYTG
jgi:iron complex transport system substrate-binding protein